MDLFAWSAKGRAALLATVKLFLPELGTALSSVQDGQMVLFFLCTERLCDLTPLVAIARTPVYTDDVLHSKVSTLVYVVTCSPSSAYCILSAFCVHRSGAIRRVAVERETTTSITYENFVTDLDTGDSFAASLIDILVKVSITIMPSRGHG